MPEKDVTVNAEFEYITYYFRLEAGEGGTAFVRDQSPDAYGRYGFHAGDVFDLEAECGENYLFAGWKVTSGVEIDNWEDAVASILCPAVDFTVKAQFASSIRTLTIVSTEGGSVSPQEGELRLGSGSVLENLLAIPEEGWVFSGWESSSPEGYFKDPKNPATDFTMPDEDCTVTARFVKGGYRLWLAATAGGTVNGGIAGNYEMKMQIPLQATPGEGYEFSHWESDVAGVIWDETAADTVLTMPGQSVSVTAVFVLIGGSPAATEPDETKKQETRNFPWAALLIVLFLSAIAITLIVVREQFNLSYRYLIRKLIWKENDGDDDDNER